MAVAESAVANRRNCEHLISTQNIQMSAINKSIRLPLISERSKEHKLLGAMIGVAIAIANFRPSGRALAARDRTLSRKHPKLGARARIIVN